MNLFSYSYISLSLSYLVMVAAGKKEISREYLTKFHSFYGSK